MLPVDNCLSLWVTKNMPLWPSYRLYRGIVEIRDREIRSADTGGVQGLSAPLHVSPCYSTGFDSGPSNSASQSSQLPVSKVPETSHFWESTSQRAAASIAMLSEPQQGQTMLTLEVFIFRFPFRLGRVDTVSTHTAIIDGARTRCKASLLITTLEVGPAIAAHRAHQPGVRERAPRVKIGPADFRVANHFVTLVVQGNTGTDTDKTEHYTTGTQCTRKEGHAQHRENRTSSNREKAFHDITFFVSGPAPCRYGKEYSWPRTECQ